MVVGIEERIAVLKQYEEQCFRICFYLVRCEALACEAAKKTLLQLAQWDAFFAAAGPDQPQILRQESVKQSLHILSGKARA